MLVVGCLESPQQFVECREHLFGELRRDQVLILPALFQNLRKPLAVRKGEQAVFAEQHDERGEDRPTGHFGHGPNGEGEVARTLAFGRVDETQARAVEQEADRHRNVGRRSRSKRAWGLTCQ